MNCQLPDTKCLCCAFQLEFERSQVRRLEKEQRRITDQLEEERAQHKQLSCALAKECKWASARALEEGHRLSELSRKLDKVINILNPSRAISFNFLQSLTCCSDFRLSQSDFVLFVKKVTLPLI